MCRHLAYLGPPVTLQAVLLDTPSSLRRQAWQPRRQRHGTVNADGFGVGWYSSLRREPARYRRARPLWSDASFASIAGVIETRCALASVRDATPGMPVEESATAPFTAGPWLFSHNGRIDGWRSLLPDRTVLEAASDSALLWELLLRRLGAGVPPADAVAETVRTMRGHPPGRLNLLLTDGSTIVATACGESLFVRRAPALVVASEPYDDEPGWEPVPDGSLGVAGTGDVRITALD
jgi:glutamine amidotransferase